MIIEELSSRIRDLNVESTYTEETLEEITQEDICVELQLRVACSTLRQRKEINITDKVDTNNFRAEDLGHITNRYRAIE